jgi:hypothetical protein
LSEQKEWWHLGYRSDISDCSRCGGWHTDLEFKPFTEPPRALPKATHFAICPTNGEPILGTVADEDYARRHGYRVGSVPRKVTT